LKGNTQECRIKHLTLAQSAADDAANTHCPHASDTGGGACVAPTKATFCADYKTVCGKDYKNCADEFQKLAAGAAGDLKGNTQECRIKHLTLAQSGDTDAAKTHCPHASETGGGMCVKTTTTTTTPKATTAASGSTTQGPIAYLSQEASKGDKELQVDRKVTPTLGVGDTIILNKGATNEETLTVSGFGSILVEEGLKFNHKDGEPIILSAKALGKTDSKVSGDKKGGEEGGDPGATAGVIAVIVVVILLVAGGAVATFFVLRMRRQASYASGNMKIGPRGNKAITIASTNDMNSPTY